MIDDHDMDTLLRRALAGEEPDPALLERVKASMRKEQDMRTNKTTKRIVTLALAAALVLALGVTAYAVLDGSQWFKSWFTDLTGSGLTEGQQAYIDSAVTEIGASASANGWTMTAASTLTDGHRAYIALDVTAPEGVDMQANAITSWPTLRGAGPDGAEVPMGYGGMVWTEDGDGQANTARMLLVCELTGTDPGQSWVLTIPSYKVYDGEKGHEVILGEGPWTLELTLEPAAPSVELEGMPFDCTVELVGGLDGNITQPLDVTVDSLCIYPTCAVMTFSYEGEERDSLPAFEMQLALAGGEPAPADGFSCQWGETPEENVITFHFGVPIDPAEVTAVTLQGHELTLP